MKKLMKSNSNPLNKVLALSLIGALGLVGCRAQNPKYQTPVEEYQPVEANAVIQKVDVTPKVDILLVIDNSMSMQAHQATLSKNIKMFVDSFSQNKLLDFHFGIVAIHDSVHYGHTVHGKTITSFPQLGSLLPLKDPQFPTGVNAPVLLDRPRFVTKTDTGYLDLLEHTILMGQSPGPAYEEIFSPIMPALTDSKNLEGPNKGFSRGADAYTVIIMLTDGDDFSPHETAETLKTKLMEYKNQDASKLMTVGILSPTKDHQCAKDQNAPNGPAEIEKFLRITNGQPLSICSTHFGKELAKIGSNISSQVVTNQISLSGIPDYSPDEVNKPGTFDRFKLLFGSKELKRGYEDGWSFDPGTQVITLGPKIELGNEENASLQIVYTPVKLSNAGNPRLKVNGAP